VAVWHRKLKIPVARARVSQTGRYSDFTSLTSRDLGAVQGMRSVNGCGNICFDHVLVAVRQGQRFDAVTTGEEQFGRCTERKSKYFRLYLYSGKLIFAAKYYRRAEIDGRGFAAGAPALTHVCTVGACGTKPRRGPPATLPGVSVWRHAWVGGANGPSAAQRGHGAHCSPIFSAAPSITRRRYQNKG
jgi:hypothetical protein